MRSDKNKQIKFINKMNEKRSEKMDSSTKWTIAAVLVCALLLGAVYFFVEAGKTRSLVNVDDVITKTGIRSTFMNLMAGKNILLLGVDSNGRDADPFSSTRSDTILIINIDRFGKNINAISIPRDSKVYLANGKGVDKINAAHALGGPELTVKTIEDTFGIHISNYFVINYAGVKDFVNAIGGVPINVEKRMHYRDRTAGLNINLYPGEQVLDAEQAEGYLRFRHDAIGDIGRIKRQQKFVKAVVKKVASPDAVFKAPQILGVLSKNVKTDMNFFELTKLFNMTKNINFDKIQVATLPGKPSQHGYISYWILDPERTQDIIDRLIYRIEPGYSTENLTVNLYYPSNMTYRIEDIEKKINELGFSVKSKYLGRNSQSEIIAHTKQASFSKIGHLKKEIPELQNAQYIVAPDDEEDYHGTDFTIVLAN